MKRAVDEFEHHDWFGVERLAGGAGLKADAGERLPGGDEVGEAGDVVSAYASALVDPGSGQGAVDSAVELGRRVGIDGDIGKVGELAELNLPPPAEADPVRRAPTPRCASDMRTCRFASP